MEPVLLLAAAVPPLRALLLSAMVAMSLSSHPASEPPQGILARLATIAHAHEQAAQLATCLDGALPGCEPTYPGTTAEAAAMGLTVAWFESGFAERVQRGTCRPSECDAVRLANGSVFHRARGLHQLHASPMVSYAEWSQAAGDGYGPAVTSAYAAIRVLGFYRKRCGSVEGAFAGYATGRSCRWSGAPERLRTYRRVLGRLLDPFESKAEPQRGR